MLRLRSLLVITGTLAVDGGIENKQPTPDRKRANVLIVKFAKRLKEIRLLKTPFGALVDPVRQTDINSLIYDASRTCAKYNSQVTKTCFLWNSLICETLAGNRLLGVVGWISKKAQDGDLEVIEILPQIAEVSENILQSEIQTVKSGIER